jgi:Tfp pilus assembly protein PilX
MRDVVRSNKGAVSIFVVVFTALLITIVTVSFVRLMVREQQRASNNDLSQSAYDAALAGVEDAKRALSMYDPSAAGNPDLQRCNGIARYVVAGGAVNDYKEVQVGASNLNQAYTCVKVELETDTYEKSAGADELQLIQLKSKQPFSKVVLEWYSSEDVTDEASVDIPASDPDRQLVPNDEWRKNRPPLLETQLVQTAASFSLSQFDAASDVKSNTNTLMLYPMNVTTSEHSIGSIDVRRGAENSTPTATRCIQLVGTGATYACTAVIVLPDPIGGNASSRSKDNTYLRLVPRYNSTHYRITLKDDTNGMVKFDGVQPRVDSTGRASNLFRRVTARIELAGANVYPEAAVDVTNNFCKTFSVTDNTTNYTRGTCTP